MPRRSYSSCMADVVVRIGRPTEIMYAEYREDAASFVKELRQRGLDVAELEVVENKGNRGVVLVEWMQIIALGGLGTVGTTVTSLATTDLYKAAKRWARRRLDRKRAESKNGGSRPVGFILTDLDGNEVARWSTLEDKGKTQAEIEAEEQDDAD